MDAELQALLTLHLVPGLGPRLTAALLKRFGSAQAAVQAGQQELRQVPHIGDKLAHDLHQAVRDANVSAELLGLIGAGPGSAPTDEKLVNTWIERNDAQNYVLLGDPAVRLHPALSR